MRTHHERQSRIGHATDLRQWLPALFFVMILPHAALAQTAKVYWADPGIDKIKRANLDGSGGEPLVMGIPNPQYIDIDLLTGRLYWADPTTHKIQRGYLHGSSAEDVMVAGLQRPYGIAVDSSGRKLYWTDWDTHAVHRANLDGSNVESLVTGLLEPLDIDLDVSADKMYWSSKTLEVGPSGFLAQIQRANLDGSSVEDLLTGINGEIGGLAVGGGKMYWTHGGSIRRSNLDGSGLEVIITSGVGRPFGIDVDVAGSKIYWGSALVRKIQRADLDGSSVEDLVGPSGIFAPVGVVLGPATISSAVPGMSALGVFILGTLLTLAMTWTIRRRWT